MAALPFAQHPKKQAMVLAAAKFQTIGRACVEAKTNYTSHETWYKEDTEYAELFDLARAKKAEEVADAIRRSIDSAKPDGTLLWKYFCYLEPSARKVNDSKHQHEHKGEVHIKKVILETSE